MRLINTNTTGIVRGGAFTTTGATAGMSISAFGSAFAGSLSGNNYAASGHLSCNNGGVMFIRQLANANLVLLTQDTTRLTISGTGLFTVWDGGNFALATGTGTKWGTATTQKQSWWNATPVMQPSSTGTTTGFTAGAGTAVLSDSTFTGGSGTKAYTIGDLVLHMKTMGLLASS
jgi:hypothetical protein